MAHKDIPEGFTVAYVEGKWYPLEAYRLYTIDYPEGFLTVDLRTSGFLTRREARQACEQIAHEQEVYEQQRWLRYAWQSDVYPERCAHYIAIIEQVTGCTPWISSASYARAFNVSTSPHVCHDCKAYIFGTYASATTIEDALEKVAQQVYANRCVCERVQELHLQLTA